ncbi:MAG TPA: hypothetical protein ENJ56_07420, partial [Anaerolineae bacterium]|nr:hypothetical protein [Anaerolineae bacterium]
FVSDEDSGAGSVAVKPSWTGLAREFPATNELADNQSSAAKAELGMQLFFDPVLSADNQMSCATCHQPDQGFSNGQAITPSRSNRNVPTLWNVAYRQYLLWDGSETALENQALTPLTHSAEMNADLDATVAELAAIPAYAERFKAVFGEDGGISAENITKALATFERTLISTDSPFDKYAAGDKEALTPAQRRGLTLFRSGATRCFECHAAPTFAQDTFRVVGVDSDDPGRAAVEANGIKGAFRVPTLRNIALTAPYMHNGMFETLEEVVTFYADGGGRDRGVEFVDPFVGGFDLNEQETADLVAFLHALTDESRLPEIPTVALSGLATLERSESAGRAESLRLNSAEAGGLARQPREPQDFTVTPNSDIQAIIDRAQAGDRILVEYGIYNMRLAVDVSGLTIEGIPNAAGDYPIFDGENKLSEAIIASGNDFAVGKLHVRNYTSNGILVEGVDGVHFYDLISENTGTYGIYPTKSDNVLVERVTASLVNDAAIYAGQCKNVVVRDSEVFGSVIGIELENTLNGEAYNNYAHDNSLGLFVVVLPQLNSKVSRGSKLYDNRVENNNIPNFADEGMAAALVPPGVGILSLGADDVEIYNNVVKDHRTTGVAVFSLAIGYDQNEIDVGPTPENNWIHNNEYSNNGYDPVASVKDLGIPVGDVIWDGSGWNVRFDEADFKPGFPKILAKDSWATWQKRLHWHTLNLIVKLAG